MTEPAFAATPRIPMAPWLTGNCLEALHVLGAASASVPIGTVAEWLGTPRMLTAVMLAAIAEEDLVDMAPDDRVTLTVRGRSTASQVVRRRRAVEALLRARDGYTQEAAQIIAARMAHLVSDALVEESAREHGEPDLEPAGQPVPAWALQLRAHPAWAGEKATRMTSMESGAPLWNPTTNAADLPTHWRGLPLPRGEVGA